MKVVFKDGTIMDTEDGTYKYKEYVKRKLIEWKEEFESEMGGMDLNYSKIADEMRDHYKIETTPAKVGAMFNIQEKRAIQLPELMALAQMFDIPILDICGHPMEMTSPKDYSNFVKKKRHPTSVEPISSKLYFGEYWGYYFRPKHFAGQMKPVENIDLEEVRIDIQPKGGRTTLTLEEKKTGKTFDGKPMPTFKLQGDVYRFRESEIAYSFIADPSSRKAMAIMFNYINVNADVRYYIAAGMMTFSQNNPRSPIFQKMAIFRKRQNYREKNIEDTIRGILSLNSSPITITEETIEKMIQENPVWKNALSPEKALDKGYIFSESSIRDNLYSVEDEMEKMKMLMEVKMRSILPAHEITNEPDYFSDFIKEFQLRQKEDDSKKDK